MNDPDGWQQQEELYIQHALYCLLEKAERSGFTPDDLSLMAYQFGVRYEPKLNSKRTRDYESRRNGGVEVAQEGRFGL